MQLRGGVTVACKAHNLDDQVQFLAPQQVRKPIKSTKTTLSGVVLVLAIFSLGLYFSS